MAKRSRAKKSTPAEELVPFEAFGQTFMLRPEQVEEARRIVERPRRARGLPESREMTVEEHHRWQALADAQQMRAGTYVDPLDDGPTVWTGTGLEGLPHQYLYDEDGSTIVGEVHPRRSGDRAFAPRPRVHASCTQEEYEASLEQLGMRRDVDGNWWVTRPCD